MGRAWWGALVASTMVLGVVEAILLELGPGYLSSGFNGAYLSGAAEFTAFAVSSVLVDAALVLALWALLLPLLRRVGLC
jgi:hypothetical protein